MDKIDYVKKNALQHAIKNIGRKALNLNKITLINGFVT